jgi:alpha-galactosidase
LPPAVASDEAIVEQIKALCGGEEHVSNVNMPNHGQMTGLPQGCIVETNARFSGLGVQPVVAGRLPEALELIVRPHAERQTALVNAVIGNDADGLLPLFLSDPLVAPLGADRASAMFREMVEATAHRLPQGISRAGVAA